MESEPDRRRCACGHAWLQHQDDPNGCWGGDCIDSPTRCQSFDPVAVVKPPVRRTVTRTRHDAPETSHQAAAMARLRVGSMRYDVYRSILFAGDEGRTDEELEGILGRKHQSISAARNTLAGDDLIEDSGQRRNTSSGTPAIVWVISLD